MVTIDAQVFTEEPDGFSNEEFVVVGAPDARTTGDVVEALTRAADRFKRVDSSGAEHQDHDSVFAASRAELYTPHYVSDPEVTDRGVQVYVDCQSAIEPPMADTLRRVLAEELEQVGVGLRVEAVVGTRGF